MANKVEEKKNQETEEIQEQTPKKESFFKRSMKRFGRDLLDIGIGVGIGAVAVGAVFKARSEKTAEEADSEDQETEEETEEENENVLEVSDE